MSYKEQIKTVKDYVQLPFVYDHWYVAGFKSEFDRNPKAKTLLERSVVFYRSQAGELLAFQNRCLHRSFPLSESKLDGDELVCGYHGIRYDTQGAITRIPCQAQIAERKLRKYPVKEYGDFVFIWMGRKTTRSVRKNSSLCLFSRAMGSEPLATRSALKAIIC